MSAGAALVLPARVGQPAPAAVAVRPFQEADAARWDAFVEGCAEATFFHRIGWRGVIERNFGHQAHYLLAERGGRITGVLPLVHMKSRLFGNALVSLPFCVQGGPAAEDDASRHALATAAVALWDQLGAGHLEFRSTTPSQPDWAHKRDFYAIFRKALPRTAREDNVYAFIPRKQRKVVRRGFDAGCTVTFDRDVDRMHRIYAESVRNLGTPVFARQYFRDLAETFGDDCDVGTAARGGVALSSILTFYFRGTALPYYGGGRVAARAAGANDVLYFEALRHAIERGCATFDFGRSKAGTGAFAFKCNWGFEPTWLAYEYKLPPGAAIPEKNPLSPKYRLMVSGWKRLPLFVANRLGPWIARDLG